LFVPYHQPLDPKNQLDLYVGSRTKLQHLGHGFTPKMGMNLDLER
jgi:hypothetical protein